MTVVKFTRPLEITRENGGEFRLWMAKVDLLVAATCGLSTSDLPDCCYSDWFEDGMSPRAAAKKAIKLANE